MLYGILYHRYFPVVTTFALGDAISFVFIAIYYHYTTEKRYVLRVLGVYVGALLVMTVYTVLGANGVTHQKRTEVEYIVGSFGIFASMLLYGAGFEKIVQVLKFKTAVFIPIHMIIAGTINQALWLMYLGLDGNWFMFSSSVMCAALCVAQLVLYVIYHPSKSKGPELPTISATGVHSGVIRDESVVVELATSRQQQQSKSSAGYHFVLTPRET